MNLVVVKNIKKILKQPFESLFWKLGAPRFQIIKNAKNSGQNL